MRSLYRLNYIYILPMETGILHRPFTAKFAATLVSACTDCRCAVRHFRNVEGHKTSTLLYSYVKQKAMFLMSYLASRRWSDAMPRSDNSGISKRHSMFVSGSMRGLWVSLMCKRVTILIRNFAKNFLFNFRIFRLYCKKALWWIYK